MMNMEKIEMVVKLVQSKIEILKLKADAYTWQCYIDNDTKEQLNSTLSLIDNMLSELRTPRPTAN
jgi:hypothetical protein